jgi:hypothetical protein
MIHRYPYEVPRIIGASIAMALCISFLEREIAYRGDHRTRARNL